MIGLPDLEGHWRRAWLKAPGRTDHETAVHWMQSGTVYADIRIPCPRPDIRGDIRARKIVGLGRTQTAGLDPVHEADVEFMGRADVLDMGVGREELQRLFGVAAKPVKDRPQGRDPHAAVGDKVGVVAEDEEDVRRKDRVNMGLGKAPCAVVDRAKPVLG